MMNGTSSVYGQTPPVLLTLNHFNYGMIATGNHNFERFAALCNTLSGEEGHFVPKDGEA